MQALAAHMRAQRERFAPSFWNQHQTWLPVGLIGSVFCMAMSGGIANGVLPVNAALIAGASIRCARPTGLSGCVTTPTSSCTFEFRRERKAGTPISPVPMKRTRIAR
jgi:hypothetical protein